MSRDRDKRQARLPEWWNKDVPESIYHMARRLQGKGDALLSLNEALREHLADSFQHIQGRAGVALREWSSQARMENLVEWLDAADWAQVNSEDRAALSGAVEYSYKRARQESASIALLRLGMINPELDIDKPRGAKAFFRAKNLGPPTSNGKPPGFDALRWMLSGFLWSCLAPALSSAKGERWLLGLAALWAQERITTEQERFADWNPPAIVPAVLSGLIEGHAQGLRIPGTLDAENPSFPVPEQDTIVRIIERAHEENFAVLRTIDAHRGLFLEISKAHEQHLSGEHDPRRLVFEGGWQEMALQADAKQEKLRELVVLQAHGIWNLQYRGSGNLLTYQITPAAPGRKASLVLVLGDPLCFGFVHQFPKGSANRKLIPMLPPPKCIGEKKTHGEQVAFQHLVVKHLREHAEELLARGSVQLDAATRRKLADLARLPHKKAEDVLDWLAGGADRLIRKDKDRYTLSDTWSGERAFILSAAQASQQGRLARKKRRRSS